MEASGGYGSHRRVMEVTRQSLTRACAAAWANGPWCALLRQRAWTTCPSVQAGAADTRGLVVKAPRTSMIAATISSIRRIRAIAREGGPRERGNSCSDRDHRRHPVCTAHDGAAEVVPTSAFLSLPFHSGNGTVTEVRSAVACHCSTRRISRPIRVVPHEVLLGSAAPRATDPDAVFPSRRCVYSHKRDP